MPEPTRFTDAAAYERFMGKWSVLVADVLLSWVAGRRRVEVARRRSAYRRTHRPR